MGQITDLAVPRARRGYYTQLFEQYQRCRDELDRAIGEMFVKGNLLLTSRVISDMIHKQIIAHLPCVEGVTVPSQKGRH